MSAEKPLELRLLESFEQVDRLSIKRISDPEGLTRKEREILAYHGLIAIGWPHLGKKRVGGLEIYDETAKTEFLWDNTEQQNIHLIVGVAYSREAEQDQLTQPDPASKTRVLLDHEEELLPGLPAKYREALLKIANNQVVRISSPTLIDQLVAFLKRFK